jgi:predicted flap endonuclease-1-like 5' DNA nuclease
MEGIGHTFEKRLYDAGICTYESLASASVQLLEAICHAPAQVKPDYAAWIKQAKSLAAKKAKRGHKA